MTYMVRNYAGPGSALNHKSMRVRKLALPYRTELGKDSTVTLTPTLGYNIGHKKKYFKTSATCAVFKGTVAPD